MIRIPKYKGGCIMQEYKPFKSGKVREIYDIGDSLIMVASDRISAFRTILKNTITDKGGRPDPPFQILV